MKRICSHKQYKLVIYLFAEGLRTEYQYIYDYIKQNKKDALVRIVKQRPESDCIKLTQTAIDFEKNQSWKKVDAPHQTWIMFDHDGNEVKVNQALKRIKEYNKSCVAEKRIDVAFMKPCVEIWALMHFRNHFSENKIQLQKELHKVMPSYDHENNPIFDLKLLTEDKYKKACARAQNWYNSLDDKDNPNSGGYYAGIYVLMQEIDKIN